MATKRMLVDASHPEETRIVVTSGNKLEEFDFESANRRQLRGNIYLAKVTRVEPSLQAAFVDYGGNRHGFLAFSEIHPDYYQIPAADREALLRAEAEANAARAEMEAEANALDPEAGETETPDEDSDDTIEADAFEGAEPDNADAAEEDIASDGLEEDENFDDLGGGEGEDLLEQRRKLTRRYKIQEVIKRRQVLLVQVVKEERGNKGAALTTYLSLAGRYSVLMPNTARGGGISRKITSASDRKRLKQIAGDLKVPSGMGVILRTAGASRTKAEIKRDFEYLSRLWENVRELTMKSSAPSLVYEEGSLIKRTIRDLYNKDISEVLVAGDAAYREAKDFMRLIMPSHTKSVQAYKEDQHIFTRFSVESQLDSMFSPQVTLPSGGYLVINPTEALVSVDVNSGRATKEHNIEATALQTNLEAADELARQLRLRDLAGLIVIDFIDMTERRSIRNVEKRMKDALKNDRARIQVGRISHFGLLEMSRQRMRFGVLESSTSACPTCEGTGIVRSVESSAIMVMRAIEDHVVRRSGQSVEVRMPSDVALYILNAKRALLIDLEKRLNLIITISTDNTLSGSQFVIDRSSARPAQIATNNGVVSMENTQIAEETGADSDEAEITEPESTERQPRKRRRRRSTGSNNTNAVKSSDNTDSGESSEQSAQSEETPGNGEQEDQPRKRRRRGRRGGRRNRRNPAVEAETAGAEVASQNADQGTGNATKSAGMPLDAPVNEAGPDTSHDQQNDAQTHTAEESTPTAASLKDVPAGEVSDDEPKKPARKRTRRTGSGRGKAQKSEADGTDKDATETEQPAIATQTIPHASDEKPAILETPQSNGAERPPRKRKPLAEEGVIVTSSDDTEAEKPKRRGWWSLK